MTDYARKSYVRRRSTREGWALVLFAWLVFMWLRADAATTLMETSANPATPGECERTYGKRPRATFSRKQHDEEPWQHRICLFP